MDLADPRVLHVLLDDLARGLRRIALEVRESIHGGEQTQRQLFEQSQLLARRIELLRGDVAHAGELANMRSDDVARASHHARDAMITAQAADRDVKSTAARAAGAVAKWNAEVSRAQRRVAAAQSWVLRAENRVSSAAAWVSRARSRVTSAEMAVSRAQSELASAESALSSCRQPRYETDSNGNSRTVYNNCSGEESRVSSARSAVFHARSELANAEAELQSAKSELLAAELELDDARRELANAHADLSYCQQCLGVACAAAQLTQDAAAHANAALIAATEAVDGVSAAQPPLRDLLANQAAMVDGIQTLDEESAVAQAETTEAQLRLQWAERHAQVAEDTALLAGNELSLRMDQLIAFDQSEHSPPKSP